MRIEKRNYSRGQWRLVADDGREIDRVEVEHGYMLPVCADTKEGLVRVILAHYEQCCAELAKYRAGDQAGKLLRSAARASREGTTMTDNTQSLLDKAMHRIEDHLRRANNCRCSSRFLLGEYKSRLFLAEYEAHKANHFEDMRDMVKARQCDAVPVAWQYRSHITGDRDDPEIQWLNAPKHVVEVMAAKGYETRALGVIDQGAV